MLRIGVLREWALSEQRVALVPEVIRSLIQKEKAEIYVETKAGEAASFSDEDMKKAGAFIESDPKALCQKCPIILKIQGPIQRPDGQNEADFFSAHNILLALLDPYLHLGPMEKLRKTKATAFALEFIPRISRAQSMDVLSSQANLAGYMAVILAASRLRKILPLLMTAAGTIAPARVLILGAGVAGLQAIATAKRLGAITYAYDVRPQVKEQVESLGGKFVEISVGESGEGQGGYAKSLSEEAQKLQRQKLTEFAKDMDMIITTAQIPGKPAPKLLDTSLFSSIKSGAVVIDMASASGGNVSGSKSGVWQQMGRALLYGAENLPSMLAQDASFAYAKNMQALLSLMIQKGEVNLNFDDEIIKASCLMHEGHFFNEPYAEFAKKAL